MLLSPERWELGGSRQRIRDVARRESWDPPFGTYQLSNTHTRFVSWFRFPWRDSHAYFIPAPSPTHTYPFSHSLSLIHSGAPIPNSALTTSFGSICFGSLIAAIVQALRALANEAQNNGDAQLLACIAQCVLACIQSCVEYFNKWAFIYVGLYGYSYLEAGKNVITLFRNRGWDAIIADDLIGNVLLLVSIIVGGITGVVGIIVQTTSTFFDNTVGNQTAIAFL